MDAIFDTITALLTLIVIRNHLVFSLRRRRLSEINERNKADINRADFIQLIERRFSEWEEIGYFAMLFDLRHWTYRQFYPNPVE